MKKNTKIALLAASAARRKAARLFSGTPPLLS